MKCKPQNLVQVLRMKRSARFSKEMRIFNRITALAAQIVLITNIKAIRTIKKKKDSWWMIHFLKRPGKNLTVLGSKRSSNKVFKPISSSLIIFLRCPSTAHSKMSCLLFSNKRILNFRAKMFSYKIKWKIKVQIILNKIS